MVRQFRHGIGGFTLEIPGGMIDPEDLNPAVAGRREMQEECGYDSDDIVPLGRVHPNPAIQPNFCYSFLARNVKQVREPRSNPDGSEETEVVTVLLKSVKELIASGKINARAGDRGLLVFRRLQSTAPHYSQGPTLPAPLTYGALASKPYAHLAMAFSGGPQARRVNRAILPHKKTTNMFHVKQFASASLFGTTS